MLQGQVNPQPNIIYYLLLHGDSEPKLKEPNVFTGQDLAKLTPFLTQYIY